jgi:hypothetical protein
MVERDFVTVADTFLYYITQEKNVAFYSWENTAL